MPRRTRRPSLRVELLENRRLLSTLFVVKNTCDSGTDSLRAAIWNANAATGSNTISFDIGSGGAATISPLSPLPQITNPVVIDGTPPGYTGKPFIEIDGTNAGTGSDGLVLATGSAGSTIEGLSIHLFSGNGINITTNSNLVESNTLEFNGTGVEVDVGPSDNPVMDNIIGGSSTDGAGNTIENNSKEGIEMTLGARMNAVEGNTIEANGGNGVEISNGSNNVIGGAVTGGYSIWSNSIWLNAGNGVLISGLFTSGNVVEGNLIGTDGTYGYANENGVVISGTSNTMGGTTVAQNIISANTQDGIVITGNSNVVQGNLIGTDSSGEKALANGGNGIAIDAGTSNLIGGTATADRNIISGNVGDGILLSAGALNNQVEGNFIGADSSGTVAVSNDGDGIEVNSSSSNRIGVALDAGGNVIPGTGNLIFENGGQGILITNGGGSNVVSGNTLEYNGDNGIWIFKPAGPNTIGGTLGNTITGNVGNGVLISATSAQSIVEGNEISANGSNGIELEQVSLNSISERTTVEANILPGNYGDDVRIQSSVGILFEGNHLSGGSNSGSGSGFELAGSSYENIIGGTTPATGNSIMGLLGDGVAIDASANNNFVEGNQITGNGVGVELIDDLDDMIGGTSDGAGNTISGNTSAGIDIYAGATGDQVLQNVISGNSGDGISLTGGANMDQVLGNEIGTNRAGSGPLPNGGSGVYLANATNNTIGGIGAGGRNVISGNSLSGITLEAGATMNQVVGNFIGTDSSGMNSLKNGVDGVDLDQATGDTIGGSAEGAGNVISGNAASGISFTAGASGNQVLGNLIGTNKLGKTSLSNAGDGVYLASVTGNTIGGTTNCDRNVISGNGLSGIDLATAANGNLVMGNYIGTDVYGESAVGNTDGISISAATGNSVGGTASDAANVISGNTSIGIQIANSLASGNLVMGNLIGIDKDGTHVLTHPDATSGFPVGILINDSPGNVIGGTMTGAGNVISGFGVAVNISSFNASGNAIERNQIGTALNGVVLTNSNVIGIYINGAGYNLVGGGTSAAGNTIMGYTDYGVYLFGSQSMGNVVEGNRIGQPVTPKKLAAKHPAQQLAGIGVQGASSNLIGGATSAMGNTILGNADAGVYIFGKANSASDNKIQNNLFDNNAYGILLYNAANNGQYFTLQRTNQFKKNPIADIREFTGPVPKGPRSSRKTTTSSREHVHRDVRTDLPRHHSPQSRDGTAH